MGGVLAVKRTILMNPLILPPLSNDHQSRGRNMRSDRGSVVRQDRSLDRGGGVGFIFLCAIGAIGETFMEPKYHPLS